jgi:hypothetical protein
MPLIGASWNHQRAAGFNRAIIMAFRRRLSVVIPAGGLALFMALV